MQRYSSCILWLLLLLGLVLRLVDIHVPDLATDEAQFVLGASAAQPPIGIGLFMMAQALFGSSLLVVRSVSVMLGISSVFLILLIARTFLTKESALLVATIASLFPTHILFSRLAYLSVPLCFAWLLVLYMFLKVQKDQRFLIPLFLTCVFATFVKTQGLLFPLFLLIGSLFTLKKGSTVKCQKSIVSILLLSLIPIGLFIITSPGILATLFLYGGNMYGLSNIVDRVSTLLSVWWSLLPVLLIFGIVSITQTRDIPWSVWVLIGIGIAIGLLLGPSHQYYTTYLIYWSIPIGLLLLKWPLWMRGIAVAAILLSTLSIAGPRAFIPHSQLYHLFQEEGYWNTHAEQINDILAEDEVIIVLGPAGHHIRWYLKPRVLVGNEMDLEENTLPIVVLPRATDIPTNNGVLYADEKVSVLKVNSEK